MIITKIKIIMRKMKGVSKNLRASLKTQWVGGLEEGLARIRSSLNF
jgi:hypothetical protein